MADERLVHDLWRESHDEKVREAFTPEEMRAEIFRLRHYDPLVRAVMQGADYRGASAEDRYTTLAYAALQERAKLKRYAMECAMAVAHPPHIITPGELKNG